MWTREKTVVKHTLKDGPLGFYEWKNNDSVIIWKPVPNLYLVISDKHDNVYVPSYDISSDICNYIGNKFILHIKE